MNCRTAVALGLLSAAWIVGLDYVEPARPLAALLLAVAAGFLLHGAVGRLPDARTSGLALLLLLPGLFAAPWPYALGPLLLIAGLMLHLAPLPQRWPAWAARSLVAAGAAALAQGAAVAAYAACVARSHDLPALLARSLAAALQLASLDAALDRGEVVVRAGGGVFRIAATWQLLFGLEMAAFVAGGFVLLALAAAGRSLEQAPYRWRTWSRQAAVLVGLVAAWAPLRAALLMLLFVQRTTRNDPLARPIAADQFVSAWVYALLLLPAVLLLIRFFREGAFATAAAAEAPAEPSAAARGKESAPATDPPPASPRALAGLLAALALVALGAALLVAALTADPVGAPKGGRVMFVERRSDWEPTDQPYRTGWYGELASYNYAAIYDYCGQFYEMSRLTNEEPINDGTLSRCDVLIIKIPSDTMSHDGRPIPEEAFQSGRFEPGEIAAVVRFVERGGSLLMIGDHTNVFNSTTYLNDVARRLGFTFRDDLLFRVGDPYVQEFRPGRAPHPAVQHIESMHFAVSCSVDPGRTLGRTVVRADAMWNLPPEYHASNYHPEAEYRPEMRYGPFVQIWAVRHGAGRVIAFTDSTIFSNFCTYQPGKAELMVGMLDWLNRRSRLDRAAPRLALATAAILAAFALAAAGGWLVRRWDFAWLLVAAAAVFGAAVGLRQVEQYHRWAMPPPRAVRPMERVVIDRTLSDVPLHRGAFPTDPSGRGYGLFEQWIPRIGGCYTIRQSGAAAFDGDLLVVVCPSRSVPRWYVERLVEYVRGGGRVLVIDSPDNVGTTASSLLLPFGLVLSHAASQPGEVRLGEGLPAVEVPHTCGVFGGAPIAHIGALPVAAQVRLGEGSVTAVGFGAMFTDAAMGMEWMLEPDDAMRQRFEVLYAILRSARSGAPPAAEASNE